MSINTAIISPTFTSADSIVHITILISAKLDRINFLTWRSQIEPIVIGFGLLGFLDGSTAPPPRLTTTTTTTTSDSTTSINPDFLAWMKQDQLLLGWLRFSIKETVLDQVLKCQTSAELWKSLYQVYSAVSRAKLMDLRRQLQTTTRGSLSCELYFEKMRNVADQLTAIGDSISDANLVTYILNGLGSEYNSFVVALNTRSEPIGLDDLHGLLLNHKALLNSQSVPISTATPDPVVFYANKKKFKNPGYRFNSAGNTQFRPNYPPKPPLLPSPSPIPATGTRYPPGQVPTCQICSKRGHMALDC